MIFDQLSYRKILRVEIPALFNSSNFWILLTRESRSARSRSANSSWSRACSRLDCSYPVGVCSISTAWESICLFNSQISFAARSALYSCLRISDFASATNCSFSLSKMILNWQLSNSWLDLSLLWHPVHGFPVIANIDCARWNKLSLLRVINLQQTLACRSWRYSGEASEFLVCSSSISASGYFASLSPRV